MAGAHCALGQCIDDCAGTKCPQGQLCAMGACIADPNAHVGGSSSTGGSGTGGEIVIVIPEQPGKGGAGSVDGGAGKAANAGTESLSSGSDPAKGCSCRVAGGGDRSRFLVGLALLSAWGLRRRRR